MKIVVIGGSGRIGFRVSSRLCALGHEVVDASPSAGVNSLTGEGLAAALEDAEVVLDVSNSPSMAGEDARDFFDTAGRMLMTAEKAAGVRHHVTLSIVGVDRLEGNAYFHAKMVQEQWARESGIPYTIVRSAQFLEFLEQIANAGGDGAEVRLPHAMVQLIAADDVAEALAEFTVGLPLNRIVEIAGPQPAALDELAGRLLGAKGDPRRVVADAEARYFGALVQRDSLLPGDAAQLGTISFDAWLPQALRPTA